MTCINKLKKLIPIIIMLVIAVSLCGCSEDNISYDVYESSKGYNIVSGEANSNNNLFAKDLCISDGANQGTDRVDSQVAGAAIVANRDRKEITYSQNVFDKMYPASTTKILTAIVCAKYANLDEVVTVSANACNQTKDSSVCGDRKSVV